MNIWYKIGLAILVLIVIIVAIAEYTEYFMKYYLSGSIVLHDNVTPEELMKSVNKLTLVYTSILPILNSTYSSHWSVVVETESGNYYLSASRHGGAFLFKVKRDGERYRVSARNYYVERIKEWKLRKECTLYEISKEFVAYISSEKYRVPVHCCHDATRYIIKKYTGESIQLSGGMKNIIKDVLLGPKVYLK